MDATYKPQIAGKQPELGAPQSALLRTFKKTMGCPLIAIDLALVERLASIQCSDREIAEVVGCSVDTLARRKVSDPEFWEFLQRGKARGRVALRRLQWQRAEAGSDTMLIWLGKQILAQRSN